MTLTQQDLGAIKNLVEEVIEGKTESVLVTKEDLKHLPTKDEFYGKMDEVMGELLEEKTGLAPA